MPCLPAVLTLNVRLVLLGLSPSPFHPCPKNSTKSFLLPMQSYLHSMNDCLQPCCPSRSCRPYSSRHSRLSCQSPSCPSPALALIALPAALRRNPDLARYRIVKYLLSHRLICRQRHRIDGNHVLLRRLGGLCHDARALSAVVELPALLRLVVRDLPLPGHQPIFVACFWPRQPRFQQLCQVAQHPRRSCWLVVDGNLPPQFPPVAVPHMARHGDRFATQRSDRHHVELLPLRDLVLFRARGTPSMTCRLRGQLHVSKACALHDVGDINNSALLQCEFRMRRGRSRSEIRREESSASSRKSTLTKFCAMHSSAKHLLVSKESSCKVSSGYSAPRNLELQARLSTTYPRISQHAHILSLASRTQRPDDPIALTSRANATHFYPSSPARQRSERGLDLGRHAGLSTMVLKARKERRLPPPRFLQHGVNSAPGGFGLALGLGTSCVGWAVAPGGGGGRVVGCCVLVAGGYQQ